MAKDDKFDLFQFGYTSEWALAKFFPAILRNGFSKYFNLKAICGREETKDKVIKKLNKEIIRRTADLLRGKDWRSKNTRTERHSCEDLIDKLVDKEIDYVSIKQGFNELPGDYDTATIFVKNTHHLKYIEKLIKGQKHILCEKPLVIVTDENHKADKTQLEKLEKLVEENANLILMDAEHYSAKKATIIFYERIGDMIADYGLISKIEGFTYERDNPNKQRTRNLLSKENRTGLLLDMGVHLFGIISNIGGDVTKINNAEYAMHQAYDVETYVKTDFEVNGNLFHENAKARFTFAKFIDYLKESIDKDKKQFKVTFEKGNKEDETTVTIDFNEKTVTDTKGNQWYRNPEPSNNEYENIMLQFYHAIKRKQQPRTNFKRSIKNLNTIFRIYKTFPVFNNQKNIYKTN